MSKTLDNYTGKNNVHYVDCGTHRGGTYKLKFKSTNRNAVNHIQTIYKNANASDYIAIKHEMERLQAMHKGKYIFFLE